MFEYVQKKKYKNVYRVG